MTNHQQSTPITTDKKYTNVAVSTERLNSDDIINASRNTNPKDIKVFVLGDSMVKHVLGWDITKRIDKKRKVYVRHFSGSKVDYMKPHYYMKKTT